MRLFAIERDRLDGAVGFKHNRTTGCFVASAALHADEAVFDEIEAADTVFLAVFVQCGQYLRRGQFIAVDGDRIAVSVGDRNIFRRVRCLFRTHGPPPHFLFGFVHRIFQSAAFIGNMEQVGVHRIGRFFSMLFDGDTVCFGESQKFLPAVEIPLSPGGDDGDIGIEREIAQFKTHLVVPLSGRPVTDRVRTCQIGDFYLPLGDEWAGDGCAEKIFPFIDGIGTEHRKDVVSYELFTQILDENIFRFDTEFQGLFSCRFDLFPLTDIGGECDHFTLVLILQPFQNDACIEPTGIGENDFFDLFFHMTIPHILENLEDSIQKELKRL